MKINEANCGKCSICTEAHPLGLIEKQGFIVFCEFIYFYSGIKKVCN
ncbi:MAG: hypothetical protein LBT10_03945 [Methanobrevibacter sp.]|nr:hypothetical protein [Methanobrevibacter sp.]